MTYDLLTRAILFHVDTGSSRKVLVKRCLGDYDLAEAGVSVNKIQSGIDRLIREGTLGESPLLDRFVYLKPR